MSEPIIHLLIKGEFRVWCLPNQQVGTKEFTTKPYDATCVNCLNNWRRKTKPELHRKRSFSISTARPGSKEAQKFQEEMIQRRSLCHE